MSTWLDGLIYVKGAGMETGMLSSALNLKIALAFPKLKIDTFGKEAILFSLLYIDQL